MYIGPIECVQQLKQWPLHGISGLNRWILHTGVDSKHTTLWTDLDPLGFKHQYDLCLEILSCESLLKAQLGPGAAS